MSDIRVGRAQPTAPDDALSDPASVRRFRDLRRIGIAAVVAIVAVAATGLLGQKTSSVTATGGGYRVTVVYPSVIRPGTDLRFEVSVSNPVGFGRSLTLAFDRRYFDLLDVNSLRPDPDSSTTTATQLFYTWSSPAGTEFHLSFDTTGEYGEHVGRSGSAAVVEDGRSVVSVGFSTRWEP